MTTTKMINQQTLKDGKIVLYQLADRPKKLWLCRIKVPKGVGYVYRGAGTSDLYEARKFAEDLYDEFLLKIKLGQSITGHNLSKMVEEYEAHINAKGEPTKRELAILAFLKTYPLPYFTKNKITEITPAEISRFFDWRRVNSKKKAPRETTILHETSMLSSFLNWAHKRGLIEKRLELEKPKHDGDRRPHFDQKDWAKLTRHLRESADAFIGLGETLVEAKETLSKDEFELFLKKTGLNNNKSTISKLMKIGENAPRLRPYANNLPQNWTTIYALSKLEADQFEKVVPQLNPYSTAKDVAFFADTQIVSKETFSNDLTISLADLDLDTKQRVFAAIKDLEAEYMFGLKVRAEVAKELSPEIAKVAA